MKYEALKLGQSPPKSARLVGKNNRCDAVTGSSFTFQIATVNCQSGDLGVSVLNPEGHVIPSEGIQVTRNKNGVFDVTFEVSASGYYVVNLHVDDLPVDSFPLLVDTLDELQVHPRLQAELKNLRSLQERIRTEEVHPLAFHLFVDSKTREINGALEKIQQVKVSAAGLLGVGNHHCDGYIGQKFALYLPTVNSHLGDFEVRVSNLLGQKLVESPEFTKFPNGIIEVSFTISELCVHVINFSYKGTPWTPIFLHVFSTALLVETELEDLFNNQSEFQKTLKSVHVPVFNDEPSFWEFLKAKSVGSLEISSKIAEYRPKFTKLVGPSVRYDVVEHQKFTLQFATINATASDFKDVRVTHKSRKIEGVILKNQINGSFEMVIPIAERGRYKVEASFNGEKIPGTPVVLHAISKERVEGNESHYEAIHSFEDANRKSVLPCGVEELEHWAAGRVKELAQHLVAVKHKQVEQFGVQDKKRPRVGANHVIETVALKDLELSEVSFSLALEETQEDLDRALVVSRTGDDRYTISFVPSKPGNHVLKMHVRDENDSMVSVDDFAPVNFEVLTNPEIFLISSPASIKLDTYPGGLVNISSAPAAGEPFAIATLDVGLDLDVSDLSVAVWDPQGNKTDAKIFTGQPQTSGSVTRLVFAVFTPSTQGRYQAEVFIDGVSTGLKVSSIVLPVRILIRDGGEG